eukprot:5035871-Pyramimonas_sp.AAC.1
MAGFEVLCEVEMLVMVQPVFPVDVVGGVLVLGVVRDCPERAPVRRIRKGGGRSPAEVLQRWARG